MHIPPVNAREGNLGTLLKNQLTIIQRLNPTCNTLNA